MEFIFDNNTPIYLQLIEQLKKYIISGTLQPGQRLPSVRELALQTKVNPNTMQRALSELEEMGLIYTERTNGKFVSNDSQRISQYRREYAAAICHKFFSDMEKIGFSKEQAITFTDDMGGKK